MHALHATSSVEHKATLLHSIIEAVTWPCSIVLHQNVAGSLRANFCNNTMSSYKVQGFKKGQNLHANMGGFADTVKYS